MRPIRYRLKRTILTAGGDVRPYHVPPPEAGKRRRIPEFARVRERWVAERGGNIGEGKTKAAAKAALSRVEMAAVEAR